MPEVFAQLDAVRHKLEKHYGDMQDLEFVSRTPCICCRQKRKKNSRAALNIAVDMAAEKLITQEQAINRSAPKA